MGLIAALVVGTLLVVSGIGYYFSGNALKESLNQTEQQIAKNAAGHVQSEIEIAAMQLEDLASIDRLQSGDKTQILPALKEAHKRIGKFDHIFFASPDGMSINDIAVTSNYADREYFQKVVNTKKLMFQKFLPLALRKNNLAQSVCL